MIRVSILIWLLLIAGAGGALYHLKYKVIALEAQLEEINGDIEADRDAIAMLHAEWSYLNDPAQIETYATHHLGTRPATVHDIITLADIPMLDGANPTRPQIRPDGTLPPLPPFAPERNTIPGEDTPPIAGDDTDSLMMAGAEPAPELSLVPAAPSRPAAVTAVAPPQDAIGALISNVLDARAETGDADLGTVAVSFPQGTTQ